MRVISIDKAYVDGDLNFYGIVFNDHKIEKFIHVPNDYNSSEFIMLVKNEIIEDSNTVVIYDSYGEGSLFECCFKTTVPINSKEYGHYPTLIENIIKTHKLLNDLTNLNDVSNIYFDEFSIEHKKLFANLSELEINVDTIGRIKVKDKNNKSPSPRATCFLNYFMYLNQRKA